MKRQLCSWIGFLAVLAMASALFAGQSSTNYKIPADVLSGGGASATSTGYQNNGSLGQSSPLDGSTSTLYDNFPGFWQADWCLWDVDNDMLGYCAELLAGSDPLILDSDFDGLNDGEEVLFYHTDPMVPDSDHDGLSDGAEVNTYHSDPNLPDSDFDGLSDGDEALVYGTSPIKADTDDDQMPDPYEVSHSCLLPSVNDAAADPEFDGVVNIDEYYNSWDANTSDPCDDSKPKIGRPGMGFFGDADGSLSIGGPDKDQLALILSGNSPSYSPVYPAMQMIQDFDGSGSIGGPDLDYIKLMLSGNVVSPFGWPTDLTKELPAGVPSIQVGHTVAIKVKLTTLGGLERPGFGVEFKVVVGTATLFGGEGSGAGGWRYDLTNYLGEARLVLRVDAEGPIEVQVRLPATEPVHDMVNEGVVPLASNVQITGIP